MGYVVGVIGAGRIGRIHTENLMRMHDVDVTRVADPRGDECAEWASSLGLDGVAKGPEAILDDPSIKAVFICSPTDTHASLIGEAAARGKNIFCEKPIDLDLGEAREALNKASRAGVRLQVGFNRRFDHNFRHLREVVASGGVGDPHIIRITSRDPEPPPPEYIASSGGIFLDMAIHDFDMARFLAGAEVEQVYATGACLVDPEIGKAGDIDTAVTILSFTGGLKAVIDNSRQAVYGYDQRVEVFGSAGSIEAENDRPNTVRTMSATGTNTDRPLWFFLERYAEAYAREARAFIDALQKDGAVPVSGEDGVAALRIALAATRSLREGRPVALEEIT